jgi:hypothetical protein
VLHLLNLIEYYGFQFNSCSKGIVTRIRMNPIPGFCPRNPVFIHPNAFLFISNSPLPTHNLCCNHLLIICPLVAHILQVLQDFQHSVGKVGTACPEAHPAVGKAYPVAAPQPVPEEESPYPSEVGTAYLVEAKVNAQAGSQDEVEDRRSCQREVVA